ncbi:agamous-like MADS-box protein AGL29 [Salvia miltiorrhiza]|uniref:agamous-like MADS-box protein AGL29 n=1 Tax=Salvia miltiorrhiza TaxID=226208 RepID=UPI0025AD8887|nr:agamous-like MADS-box protein AGL29 [Salvia miltiorrhiza]
MNASDDGSNNPSQSNTSESEQKKKGKGRQKITMAKIENETNLQVTFSKRRAGVFKKASELSTLCGAESAVVVFSPGNKPHSFGHPNVETVANRFLHASGGAPSRSNAADQLIMAHSEAAMQQRNQELVGTEAELERERQRKKELDSLPAPPKLDELDYEQLDRLRKSVMGFKREFEAKVKKGAAAASSSVPAAYGYGGGSGSGSAATYGYTVHYPPAGDAMLPYNNYGNPASVVQYDAATGTADADADADAAPDTNKFRGFGRHPGF